MAIIQPSFPIGSSVEVSSDEPGFHGAWYVATVLNIVKDPLTKKKSSGKKNRMKTGYLVRYETLFEEDNLDERLTEIVDSSFVRPVPPINVRRRNDAAAAAAVAEEGGGEIEQFDVVDAFHRDGWWIGVVKKVISDGGICKFVVEFENPPEEVEFERSQLRFHVDWVDLQWKVSPKKIPKQDLAATHTSESNNDLTTPSAKEGISAKRKSCSVEKHNSRNVKTSNTRNRKFVISEEEDSRGKTTGSDGNTKGMVSTMETSGSQAINQDSVLAEEVILVETSEAEDGRSNNKRKLRSPPKSQVKRLNGSLEDEQPLSVWFHGLRPWSGVKRSLCYSPCDESSGALTQQTMENNGGATITDTATATATAAATDYQQGWPFIKQSPIWATIEETLGTHQKFTQKPHFSPLEKINEDLREGLAIAHMVTYWNLVHKISKFKKTDSVDTINVTLETLVDLETHGFDVSSIRARLNELTSLKSQLGEHKDKKEKAEKEIEKLELNKSVVVKEISQLELKLLKLQEKKLQTVEEIGRLQSNLIQVSNKIIDCDLAFEKIAATPL